ncbi:sugar phosphate isomerase/epimerase family protein [Phytoactinopolyspora halotolerans]|uniref:Sugar phosphate isomerase/epimerase n=1 Tax=Phytoactinopolyspora halotolerans TaxID=1981512 RepID=A0A6L9SCD5_9ACTN|nr:sugar phosphate isomerase/epimerase family protein [Phytoactinopolyspora halotolerans]NEE02221.1 sugar phosphate isomerase/epimerase [Phytoactinopolyspora halotolerans]
MKFAVFTVSVPEWAPAEAVQRIAEAGYDGVEWRVTDQQDSPTGMPSFWAGNRCTWPASSFPDDVPAIKELTDDAGLEMPALGTYLQPGQFEQIDTTMRAAAQLGVRQLRVSSGGYEADRNVTGQWNERRKQYAEVARLAAQHGVRANIEIHHQQLTPSPHAAAAFLDGLDPEHAGAIFDIGNMVWEGWTEYRFGLEALGPYLAHVQVKNGAVVTSGVTRDDGTVEWSNAQLSLREGFADIPAFLTALTQVGYDGWVSVEDFSDLGGQTRAERIADNLAYLKQASAD